jgi:hypothetical protein
MLINGIFQFGLPVRLIKQTGNLSVNKTLAILNIKREILVEFK